MIQYKLRPYQQEVSDLCLSNTGKDICLCAPVASGKTVMAYDIAQKSQGRVAIVTYANELLLQFINEFPLPYLIGKNHYCGKPAYDKALKEATEQKIAIFNPVTYVQYLQKDLPPFDTVIWDEADACLGLLQLVDQDTYAFPYPYASDENIIEAVAAESSDWAFYLKYNLHKYWWTIEERKMKGRETRALVLRPLVLSKRMQKLVKANTNILMSGTLLPSSCREILGHSDYLYSELPSPIPLENRPIKYFSDEIFVNTLEGQAALLKELLEKFDARPAIVHTSYAEAKALKELMPQDDVIAYESPDAKLSTLSAAEGKQVSVLAGGATTGLNLKDDRCRLNVVLRGAFANLGGDFVRRRKSLEGGEEWYVESVLRHLVQACGRSTRGPEDYSMTVIADQRLISLANRNRDLLPNYFLEAFDRRLDDLWKCS